MTAEKILEELKSCAIYFPLHDTGVDLLIVRENKHVGVQVKESRYFTSCIIKGTRGHSWHQIDKRKIENYRRNVDFFIFLTYIQRLGKHKVSSFDYKFLIVPTSELLERTQSKNPDKNRKYSFYFYFDGQKVIDVREKTNEPHLFDYSQYLDAWHLIDERLKR